MTTIIDELFEVLQSRRSADASESYVASLHAAGLNKILEKVGEEATETILAAKDCNDDPARNAVVKETADLWFHTLVMLDHLALTPDHVLAELQNRFGISGLEEKQSRSNKE